MYNRDEVKGVVFLDGLFTYHADVGQSLEHETGEYALANKRRVVQFVEEWCKTIDRAFWEDKTINAFLEVGAILFTCNLL